ncbi:VOC family protein [Mucilaginibacter terrenus]|uniref:VOC family protein n=1 Tax=Mucilaginibacter terrenus TaxID=2482727 RepID=A0A3E2NPG8_9SPHI|nr:VOC family protein [Mucilaginibacter terrenus]RFZ82906.1 VOC family protein [Mucilaginibacter terrenus]
MSKISAYINFKNTCREAMTFYQQCLGGELQLIIVKNSPMAEMFPAEMQDSVLHADLTARDLNLLASDMQDPSVAEKTGGPVSLTLSCDSKEAMFDAFAKLSDGGTVTCQPEVFFAGTMGNLVDKFGIRWGVFTAEK